MNKTIHHGHNVKRFREMLGIKQEGLAHNLGADWNQKKISILEGKQIIDEPLLEQIAESLKLPADSIRNFDVETAVNIISNNTFNGDSTFYTTPDYVFTKVDELIAVMKEKEKLYQQLIASEREKNELLRKLLEEKQKQK